MYLNWVEFMHLGDSLKGEKLGKTIVYVTLVYSHARYTLMVCFKANFLLQDNKVLSHFILF